MDLTSARSGQQENAFAVHVVKRAVNWCTCTFRSTHVRWDLALRALRYTHPGTHHIRPVGMSYPR
jgi:hypothetical protein